MSNAETSEELEPPKGIPSPRLEHDEFMRRYLAQFQDPAFEPPASELDRTARILLIKSSPRTEHTCPSKMSKGWRLLKLAQDVFASEPGIRFECLDLSRLVWEYERHIHPARPASPRPRHSAIGLARDTRTIRPARHRTG